jgi:hypothetical protein
MIIKSLFWHILQKEIQARKAQNDRTRQQQNQSL